MFLIGNGWGWFIRQAYTVALATSNIIHNSAKMSLCMYRFVTLNRFLILISVNFDW